MFRLHTERLLTAVHTDTTKEIVIVGHIKHLCRQFRELKALDIINDSDKGHAGNKIISVVSEVKVIDSQHVGVQTVNGRISQQNSLRAIGSSISIVPSNINIKPHLTNSTKPYLRCSVTVRIVEGNDTNVVIRYSDGSNK